MAARVATFLSCSINVTSCPRSARSLARWRPTFPAPVMTTFIRRRPPSFGHGLQQLVQPVHRVEGDEEVGDVSLLERVPVARDEPPATSVDARNPDRAGLLHGGDLLPHQMVRDDP